MCLLGPREQDPLGLPEALAGAVVPQGPMMERAGAGCVCWGRGSRARWDPRRPWMGRCCRRDL